MVESNRIGSKNRFVSVNRIESIFFSPESECSIVYRIATAGDNIKLRVCWTVRIERPSRPDTQRSSKENLQKETRTLLGTQAFKCCGCFDLYFTFIIT